jgi:excisionase family DNA binding protein
MSQATESPWLTTAEAASYLKISANALRLHIARGHLKPDHMGGRGRLKSHRFSRATLDRFVAGDKAA